MGMMMKPLMPTRRQERENTSSSQKGNEEKRDNYIYPFSSKHGKKNKDSSFFLSHKPQQQCKE